MNGVHQVTDIRGRSNRQQSLISTNQGFHFLIVLFAEQNYIKIVQPTKQIYIKSVHPIKQKRKFFGFVLIAIEVLFIKNSFWLRVRKYKNRTKKEIPYQLTNIK